MNDDKRVLLHWGETLIWFSTQFGEHFDERKLFQWSKSQNNGFCRTHHKQYYLVQATL